MASPAVVNLERQIAKCRVALSIIAVGSVYLDPATPQLGMVPVDGVLGKDGYAFTVLAAHLLYAVGILLCIGSDRIPRERLAMISTWLDVAFGGAVAIVTEGATSPARIFFAFAVLAVACRSGFRAAVVVTVASVSVYLGITNLSALPSAYPTQSVYTVRSFHLAITGYLIGYLAQQRWNVEAETRTVAMAAERHGIARSLHDGYVQALAGVSLRIQACRELLRRERTDRALAELSDLQTGIQREYEEVRAYVRSLVDLDRRIDDTAMQTPDITLDLQASFRCGGATAEHILLIMLEGVRNARQHAGARAASVSARDADGGLTITIRDDGVGLAAGTGAPWSIASRVSELGGDVEVGGGKPGAHLIIEIPTA